MSLNTKELDAEDLKLLIKEYNRAIQSDKEYFVFLDKILYTGYAKYLIEYLKIKYHPI